MKCYNCNGNVKTHKSVKEGVTLTGMRCEKCGEEYYASGELLRFEALTGRTKRYRKFGKLGQSTIIRIPEDVIASFKIEHGDLGRQRKSSRKNSRRATAGSIAKSR